MSPRRRVHAKYPAERKRPREEEQPDWRLCVEPPESARQPVAKSQEDPRLLDDFELIAERARVTQILAALTDEYRRLTHEMNQRTTLRWMLR